MLRRIAVVTSSDGFFKACEKAAKQTDARVVQVRPGDSPPPASAGLIASSQEDASGALQSAIGLAGQCDELLVLLAEAIDRWEGVAAGSSLRVREHAERFAVAAKLSDDEHLALTRAALVRGIGMLSVPTDILFKKDVLTYDEWACLRAHPRAGAEVLAATSVLRDVAEAVGSHHECYDGTGYPEGLEGEEIPTLGRMLKILDVYCAMTSPRHYRAGQTTHEEAAAHLREERGKHFDPGMVDKFIRGKVGRV